MMLFDFKKKTKLKPKLKIEVPASNEFSKLQSAPSSTPIKSKKTEIPSKPKVNAPFKRANSEKDFLNTFKQLTYRHRAWDVWKDFVTMFACALSNPVDKAHYDEREALYMRLIKKYNKQEQALFPELVAETVMALEINPEQDFLGKIFMTLDLGDDGKGQIFTPYHVCELMAKISLGEVLSQVDEKGYITINDPCCGAGATLIAGINEAKRQLEKAGRNFQNHVLVVAQDIDETAALMCYIQLSLLGVAAYIKIGNSLLEPISSNDTMKDYWFTPMYFFDVWAMRRLFDVH